MKQLFDRLVKAIRVALHRSLRKQVRKCVPPQEILRREKSLPSISGIDESTKEGSIQQTQVQNAEPTPAPLIQEPVIKAPLSVPRLLIPDTSAPIPGQGGNGNGLSPGSLSPGRPANLRRHSNVSLRSSGGYSSSSKNSVDGTWLNAQLRRARIEYHRHAHSYIIPTCKQKELITAANIEQDIRDKDDSIEEAEIKHVAQKACAIAPKVFATLALMKKGPEICSLLRDGISDEDLPLKRREKGKGDFTLERDSGVPIETFEHWNEDEKEDFDRVQWWMIAPVFKHKEHHELDERAILPFIPFETNTETEKKKEGGYSEVFARRIHPSHHNFWGPSKLLVEEPLVAIKRLHSSDEIEFRKEEHILKALGSQPTKHLHLITLLATFKHHNKYHLVFRWADANLRKYWKDRPSPSFDEATVLWCLKQMTGIAHALDSIHNFTTTHPLSMNSHSKVGDQKDAKSSSEKKETWYGRHGDIKAENILWFREIPESEDIMGVLQIADFGLGRFHGRDSRSKIDPDDVQGSPAYEPPERKLHKPISRTYDIWSLGCLYLEFITWLLKGSAEIDGFSGEDNFFTITNDGSDAVVRDGVVVWVQQLHKHPRCSALIHSLLDLIMKHVLIPDSKKRISAAKLWEKLNTFLGKAAGDKVFLLKPAPWR